MKNFLRAIGELLALAPPTSRRIWRLPPDEPVPYYAYIYTEGNSPEWVEKVLIPHLDANGYWHNGVHYVYDRCTSHGYIRLVRANAPLAPCIPITPKDL